MLPKILFISLFLALSSHVAADCDRKSFEDCQAKFTDFLGVDSSYNWMNPDGLTQQIENVFANGRKARPTEMGIVGVCNAYGVMLDCMMTSGLIPTECFDPLFLINNDSRPNVAYHYAFLMNMIKFQCGAGLFPAIDNWPCLERVYKGKSDSLNSCTNKFYQNIAFDSDNACQYVQEGTECWQKVVSGCGLTAKYYACESFKEFTKPKYNYCSASCKL